MYLAFVCSPYRGEIERNTEYAKKLAAKAISLGFAPVIPHLMYTQFLDDGSEFQRDKGMKCGLALLEKCDVLIIGGKYGISEGMEAEIRAFNKRIIVLND
jgi:hypothetical protein